MDTDIDIFVESDSPPPAAAFVSARLLFEQQEERFSRFRDSSLLSALNRGEVVESPWLARAVAMAIDAFELTGGLFNPMVLPALRQAGYDRSFAEVSGGVLESTRVPDPKRTIRVADSRVELLAGQVDLGGIIKGWTADLVAESLAPEAPNVFVNAGGDIRCLGSDGAGPGWAIDVDSPEGGQVWAGRLRHAIATSTTLKRRWITADGATAHHLIDPATGMPSDSPFVQVSARAEACWLAEVWAKAVLIGGEEAKVRAERAGVPVLAITSAGSVVRGANW
jgi:thiamine biosynthesis lipoprotein